MRVCAVLKQFGRNDEPLSVYEAKMDKINQQLASEGHTLMCGDELIAVRLYSGPMCVLAAGHTRVPCSFHDHV